MTVMRSFGWLLGILLGVACSGPTADGGSANGPTSAGDGATNDGGCRRLAAGDSLVTHWAPAEREELMRRIRERTAVILRADTCRVELVEGCVAAGEYAYESAYGEQERRAPKSGGDGEKVALTTAGRYRLAGQGVFVADALGDCADASHVVTAVQVGAWASPVKSAGERERCKADGTAPPEGCDAPLVLAFEPLKAAPAKPAPSASAGDLSQRGNIWGDPIPSASASSESAVRPKPPPTPSPAPLTCMPDDVFCRP